MSETEWREEYYGAVAAGLTVPGLLEHDAQAQSLPLPQYRSTSMCRNIKTLFNFEPPATDEEIRASSIQFVRKLSGSTKPSKANEAAFDAAVDEITRVTKTLLDKLVTDAPARDRELEAEKARARARKRFGHTSQGNAAQFSP
jgi:hypothetical protein